MITYPLDFPYSSWRDFMKRVVTPAVHEDGDGIATTEFERVCREHAPFVLACMWFMSEQHGKDVDILLTRIDELEDALRRAGGAD